MKIIDKKSFVKNIGKHPEYYSNDELKKARQWLNTMAKKSSIDEIFELIEILNKIKKELEQRRKEAKKAREVL